MQERASVQPAKVSKFALDFDDSNSETATTKFVIVVTILGIIFFIVSINEYIQYLFKFLNNNNLFPVYRFYI